MGYGGGGGGSSRGPTCVYLHHLIPPSLPQFSFPPFLSPFLKPPHVCVRPVSALSRPLPLTCLLFSQLSKLKEQSGGEEESREERLQGTVWGENEISCAEEQMEGAVENWAWVNTSRKYLKRHVRRLLRGHSRKYLSLWGKDSHQEVRDTSGEGENPHLLSFCGLLVPNLSRGWGAVFH